MILTVMPDGIRCNQAEQHAGSYTAMEAVFADNQDYVGSQDAGNSYAVR
jgi:hypothetical protein